MGSLSHADRCTPSLLVQFRKNILAGRAKPGLLRQHLTALNAAVEIGRATVRGAELGSTEIEFTPGPVEPGDYHFAVGTAGSATLVLQTVLPALLCAAGPSTVRLEGGTHNTYAPPFDFLAESFLPIINRMGPRVTAELERHGFYPAGGGRFTVRVEPTPGLRRIDLPERGPVQGRLARALVSQLDTNIANRELRIVSERLGWDQDSLRCETITDSAGPGNILMLRIASAHITEIITAFGERGVGAEKVAATAVEEAAEYLEADVPVGRHLADQLLIPMALAGGGRFRTTSPTRHTMTNAAVIREFLGITISIDKQERHVWEVNIA
jgi:RNA 3'-terminal phosphate cyclase (ATP)